MNEAIHFLEAINAGEPNADVIYADWLEEQGKSEADEIRDPTFVVLKEWVRFYPYCSVSQSKSHLTLKYFSQSWSRLCIKSYSEFNCFSLVCSRTSFSRSFSRLYWKSSSRFGSKCT